MMRLVEDATRPEHETRALRAFIAWWNDRPESLFLIAAQDVSWGWFYWLEGVDPCDYFETHEDAEDAVETYVITGVTFD